ncbi:MAG: asparagine synthase (glutamine-hydrolyzing) [Asticcacaulis sp.]|uniref:asparagine synthase (glutamine-hydrolyzing) n=1 Tax=Asticcacaulis sp. TaxID=1872648 RepID=UPI003F7C16E2
MCGIAGVMRRETPPEAAHLQALTEALHHRGPDGFGVHVEGCVGLVHTRLAIIDIVHGQQPFVSADGGVIAIANGEIYNDPELRREMSRAEFRTGSDCECALHLYQAHGARFASALRGMYAIAIYDRKADRLVLSRDRFGIKPLYYVCRDDLFAFASEPQALIKAGLAAPSLNPAAIAELLQMQFATGEKTLFGGVCRVLPGETLVVEQARIVERFRQGDVFAAARSYPPAVALQQLERKLLESVSAHMRSDVPYGLFLSGGADSAALLAAMSRLSDTPVTALTAAFPEMAHKDESLKAQRLAKACGADHHIVEVVERDFLNTLPALAACLDDPVADASALPIYTLGAAARDLGLKVVLSGEGADELLGGYKRYRRARWLWGLWRERTRTRGIVERSPGCSGVLARWRTGIAAAEGVRRSEDLSPIQRLQAIDCAEWLPNDLLLKFDRCLMAHGVEGRTPYLDSQFSPFAANLSDDLKVRGKHGKWLLRQWLAENLPESAPWARKQGFVAPVACWTQGHAARLVPLLSRHPAIMDMSLEGHVERVFADARQGQAAWNLLFYALWHSVHWQGVDASGDIFEVLDAGGRQALSVQTEAA